MAWTDYISYPFYLPLKVAGYAGKAAESAGLSGGIGGQSDKKLLRDQLKDKDPWTNNTGKQWTDLLQEQRATALGNRPTMAQLQYRQAMQDTRSSLAGAANGTNRPGVMRASMQQQANLGQGMASGLAQADLQERMAAQQQYMAGLTGAGQVDARQNETWLKLMGILQGKPPDPTMWDRTAAMAPYIAAMV